MQFHEQLAHRPHRRERWRDRVPRVAVDRDPVRALRAHSVHHFRVQRRPRDVAEELDEAAGGLDVEQEREGGERPVQIEDRDVPPALGREQGGGGGERRRAAPAGAREPDQPALRGAPCAGAGRANRRLAHRGRGDRLDQVVAHPGEQDLPAEPGGVVRAERDHHGLDLAHRGQLMDGPGRVGGLVEVHEQEPRRMPLAERRGGSAQTPGPHLSVAASGEPLAECAFACRVGREGERVDLGECTIRGRHGGGCPALFAPRASGVRAGRGGGRDGLCTGAGGGGGAGSPPALGAPRGWCHCGHRRLLLSMRCVLSSSSFGKAVSFP